MGNRSLQIEIDREGNVSPPADTTLENGAYAIFDGETEVGMFMVEEGQVGKAHSKVGSVAVKGVYLVIDLGAIFAQLGGEEQEPTWAQRLEDRLAYAESTYRVFGEGRTCPSCGQVHTLNDARELNIDPQKIVDHLSEFATYLREENVVGFLQTLLTEEQAKEREERGYDEVEEVKNHLDRVTTLLARDPLVVPPVTTPAEGRTESQEPDAAPAG